MSSALGQGKSSRGVAALNPGYHLRPLRGQSDRLVILTNPAVIKLMFPASRVSLATRDAKAGRACYSMGSQTEPGNQMTNAALSGDFSSIKYCANS